MPNIPPTNRPARPSPEWANLPRRHCDDCGKLYKPFRPLRPGIDQYGFCSPNCKKSFHKHGGAYRKLRGETRKMVEKELAKLRKDLSAMMSAEVAMILARMDPHNVQEAVAASVPARTR
jgi:hypothetical protein